jgi:hypothetical protein
MSVRGRREAWSWVKARVDWVVTGSFGGFPVFPAGGERRKIMIRS